MLLFCTVCTNNLGETQKPYFTSENEMTLIAVVNHLLTILLLFLNSCVQKECTHI